MHRIFEAIASIALRAKRRRDAEHAEFLTFYRKVVEVIPSEVAVLFGTMNGVRVTKSDGSEGAFGIQLSVTDHIWWDRKILVEGVRFKGTAISVQLDMLDRLTSLTDANRLTSEERKQLFDLLDECKRGYDAAYHP